MAADWDRRNTRPMPSNRGSYHAQTATFQPPLPDHLAQTRLPNVPTSEHHGRATSFAPPLAANSIVLVPYYEGYTIRPYDLASSEDRWSFPPRKSIPATQEDLHTEVTRQRQSGRTACRELEDCHGPKRQYIDTLINERNASTSLGRFEVAQLRLERISRDSEKASNRNSGRNYSARDYKPKESTKPRQKTVYMHIILQFIKNTDRSLTQDSPAPRIPDVSNSYHSGRQQTSEERLFIPLMSPNDQPSVYPRSSQRSILARGYPYTTGNETVVSPSSGRYISRSTQTTFPLATRPHRDYCSDGSADSTKPETPPVDDIWTTITSTEEEIPRNSPFSDNEAASVHDSVAPDDMADESPENESRSIDEYEKPPWFQNLRPVNSPGIADEETDVCSQQDDGEVSITHEEKDIGDACAPNDEEVFKAHMEGDNDYAQSSISSWSGGDVGQTSPDDDANYQEHNNDQLSSSTDNEGVRIATGVRELESTDEHPSTGSTRTPMSEHLSNLPGPSPPEKLPPAERYKPRLPLNPLPIRPSLTKSSMNYDNRAADDSERKFSKRVSFQQSPVALDTPPSTSTSSPVSPVPSPQMPLWTTLTKPAPVSIPPGQYTPIVSLSPLGSMASPSSPTATRNLYTCLEPSCDSSFDNLYDRDRHERQHEIGDPPYSACPICRHTRSSGATIDGGLREPLIAHMNRRH